MDIIGQIEKQRALLVKDLVRFTKYWTEDGNDISQDFVIKRLQALGMEMDVFGDVSDAYQHIEDYCPPSDKMHPNTRNVVATTPGVHPRSLLLLTHIDTEKLDYYQNKDPQHVFIQNNRVYGHGVCDDKAGVMMMIHALEAIKEYKGSLPGKIVAMSVLGKNGGSSGTLAAIMRGHRAQFGIYLHPAETGNGFLEIKNMSLGVIDLNIVIKGKAGNLHDDLDAGCNSNILAAQVIVALEELNKKRRLTYLFKDSDLANHPNTLLNIGKVVGGQSVGGVALSTRLSVRVRFFVGETIDTVFMQISHYLKEKFPFAEMMIEKGALRANPTRVDPLSAPVLALKQSILKFDKNIQFLHMYHGASDIRLPYLYGNCPTIGIGPLGYLPQKNSQEQEWVDLDSYIMGVQILADFILRYFA